MKIVSFGSLNLDHVYTMPKFVSPGETLMSNGYEICFGGKGLNQSVAAAKAGAQVLHAGMVGQSGQVLADFLQENGVDISMLESTPVPQGHAIIQVSPSGENCIILYSGSNFAVTREYVDRVFDECRGPGYVILQNEISQLAYIVEKAAEAGFDVVLNASPYNSTIDSLDLGKLSWLLINEVEGAAITGKTQEEDIIAALQEKYGNIGIVLTLGSQGCVCVRGSEKVRRGIFSVPVVDTTGAGDTFTGYFVASLARGFALDKALKYASAAAAIAVSGAGAAQSIPLLADVEAFLSERG